MSPERIKELKFKFYDKFTDWEVKAEFKDEPLLLTLDAKAVFQWSVENFNNWIAYDFNKMETRPTKTGRYFVHRKDGKVHWEVWNGSGWAYNNNVITHWQEITPPII